MNVIVNLFVKLILLMKSMKVMRQTVKLCRVH